MTQIIRFVNSCFIKIQFIKIQKEGDERAMLFGQDGASASLYGDLSRVRFAAARCFVLA